jgi:hypothetical protein
MIAVSLKFQITLPEDLAAEMRVAAERMGVPLAQFIRETVQEKLRQVKNRRAGDPFAWMDGLAETEETDLASRVDEILYRDAGVH